MTSARVSWAGPYETQIVPEMSNSSRGRSARHHRPFNDSNAARAMRRPDRQMIILLSQDKNAGEKRGGKRGGTSPSRRGSFGLRKLVTWLSAASLMHVASTYAYAPHGGQEIYELDCYNSQDLYPESPTFVSQHSSCSPVKLRPERRGLSGWPIRDWLSW